MKQYSRPCGGWYTSATCVSTVCNISVCLPVCLSFCLSVCLSTVRGLIFSLQSVPYHPNDDGSGCLLAGSDVEIVCAHQAYPPATVEFFKNGIPVNVSGSR